LQSRSFARGFGARETASPPLSRVAEQLSFFSSHLGPAPASADRSTRSLWEGHERPRDKAFPFDGSRTKRRTASRPRYFCLATKSPLSRHPADEQTAGISILALAPRNRPRLWTRPAPPASSGSSSARKTAPSSNRAACQSR